VADMSNFWRALFAGKIVPARWVAEMVRPHNDVPGEPLRCGLGFFLHESRDQVMLIGQDAGVSFMSVHDPAPGLTYTVISNTADGPWPVLRHPPGAFLRLSASRDQAIAAPLDELVQAACTLPAERPAEEPSGTKPPRKVRGFRPSRCSGPLTWGVGGGDDGTRTHDPLLAKQLRISGMLCRENAAHRRP
jgi:hypothetical protein